jgi:hypothetical protein
MVTVRSMPIAVPDLMRPLRLGIVLMDTRKCKQRLAAPVTLGAKRTDASRTHARQCAPALALMLIAGVVNVMVASRRKDSTAMNIRIVALVQTTAQKGTIA